jgi:gamma-D-glutamyl-L-lysine dipeptidyl-peptidase
MFAVCTVGVASLRKEPDHKAEMTSQLLFGECCIINEAGPDGFVKIKVKHDGYEGWCMVTQLTEVSNTIYNTVNSKLAAEWVNNLVYNNCTIHIPFGSRLPMLQHEQINWGRMIFDYNGAVYDIPAQITEDAVRQIAFSFLNTPYLWGGRSVFGTDCSGFTQTVFTFFNIALQRDACQQAAQGTSVDFLQQARCGDLAFFDNEAGDIIHVGLLLSSHEIIHASGKVQIDNIDNGGIINKTTGQRTQKLRIIKRFF